MESVLVVSLESLWIEQNHYLERMKIIVMIMRDEENGGGYVYVYVDTHWK